MHEFARTQNDIGDDCLSDEYYDDEYEQRGDNSMYVGMIQNKVHSSMDTQAHKRGSRN